MSKSMDENPSKDEQVTSTVCECSTPGNKTLSSKEKLNDEQYAAWIGRLSNDQLQSEQSRISQEIIQAGSGIAANGVVAMATFAPTAFISLIPTGLQASYETAKVIYYRRHRKMCDAELRKRGLPSRSTPDDEKYAAMGAGALKTFLPAAGGKLGEEAAGG